MPQDMEITVIAHKPSLLPLLLSLVETVFRKVLEPCLFLPPATIFRHIHGEWYGQQRPASEHSRNDTMEIKKPASGDLRRYRVGNSVRNEVLPADNEDESRSSSLARVLSDTIMLPSAGAMCRAAHCLTMLL